MLIRQYRPFSCVALFFLLAGVLAPPSVQAQNPFADFPQRVETARQQWGAPGLAIAVVHKDRVVLAAGFGVRDVSTGEAVDEHTLFHVGSTTKAFTAVAAGLLVEEGRLAWNDKVIDHLPAFRVADPYVTSELTIADLLTHRSGVQGTDLLWVTGLSSDQFLSRLVHAEQASSLRSQFEYNNGMYLIAGQLVGAVGGSSYADFVRKRLFQVLWCSSMQITSSFAMP